MRGHGLGESDNELRPSVLQDASLQMSACTKGHHMTDESRLPETLGVRLRGRVWKAGICRLEGFLGRMLGTWCFLLRVEEGSGCLGEHLAGPSTRWLWSYDGVSF